MSYSLLTWAFSVITVNTEIIKRGSSLEKKKDCVSTRNILDPNSQTWRFQPSIKFHCKNSLCGSVESG